MARKNNIDLDFYIKCLIDPTFSGVFAANRKELEFIEKQRAGSIGSIDHEIRKIKTELYHEILRKNELSYLDKQRHSEEERGWNVV